MDTLIELFRWIIAIPAALLFTFCVLGNWSLLLGAAFGRLESFTLILPFLGPVFGIVFFMSIPIDRFQWYWWLAVIIEPSWFLAAWCLMTAPFSKHPNRPDVEPDSSHDPEVK
jgi:hypothetical protein